MPSKETQFAMPRSLQFALFLTGCLWLYAAQHAASHGAMALANHFRLAVFEPLLEQVIFLLLLVVGFPALNWISTRSGSFRGTNALPRRESSHHEWMRGAVLGWATLLLAVAPVMLSGDLHPSFWLAPRAWGLAILSLATLALGTLALEVAFRGYLFKRLISAIGPVAATILMSLLYAVLSSFRPNPSSLSLAITFLLGLLLSLAYLRTHALWLGWGFHFAWSAVMGVVLGLPVAGDATYSSVVDTSVTGSDAWSGGAYGPEGALLTAVAVLIAMVLVYIVTRDYAWEYTHAPIVPGGQAVVIAPPAAHTAMETAAAAQPAPLVQILSTTSANASTLPVIEEHLRRDTPPSE